MLLARWVYIEHLPPKAEFSHRALLRILSSTWWKVIEPTMFECNDIYTVTISKLLFSYSISFSVQLVASASPLFVLTLNPLPEETVRSFIRESYLLHSLQYPVSFTNGSGTRVRLSGEGNM